MDLNLWLGAPASGHGAPSQIERRRARRSALRSRFGKRAAHCSTALIFVLASVLSVHISLAEDKSANYEEQVAPVLRNHCFKCHNPDKNKADLDLTSYNGAMKGSS